MNKSIWFIKWQAVDLKHKRSLHDARCRNRIARPFNFTELCACKYVVNICVGHQEKHPCEDDL